jgi:transcriptional regulator with XRE-family HTH domain
MNLYRVMNIKNKIGVRIKLLRNDLKISQEELGFRSNIDRTYITDVENGRRNISVEVLERVIKGLNTTFNDFFNTQDFK